MTPDTRAALAAAEQTNATTFALATVRQLNSAKGQG